MSKTCCLPVLRAGELLFFPYQHGDELKKNQFDIPEPVDRTNQIEADQLDLVLLPLVAFDGVGYRLGTGGGYYDKTFAFRKKSAKPVPLLVGLGYDCQRAAPLPADPWDIMLDAVLTEKDWHRFS